MLRFTRHGFWEMLIGSILLIALGMGLGWVYRPLALIVVPVLVWLFAFFRDPLRAIPADPRAMVSPADGKVSDITEVDHDPLLAGPAVRIGIFLSVFNVHVNRTPCDGRVVSVIYKKGKFINAMNHNAASSDNESNTLVLAEPNGDRPIAVVKQIVGLIARRIVCIAKPQDALSRGQHFGMIKFGSRTELSIPRWLDPQIKVAVGQTVHGGTDVLAVCNQPLQAAAAPQQEALA